MQLALDCGAVLTAFRSAKDFEKVASEMVAEVSVSKYLQLHKLIVSRLCSSMRAAQQQIGETSVGKTCQYVQHWCAHAQLLHVSQVQHWPIGAQFPSNIQYIPARLQLKFIIICCST